MMGEPYRALGSSSASCRALVARGSTSLRLSPSKSRACESREHTSASWEPRQCLGMYLAGCADGWVRRGGASPAPGSGRD